MKYEGFDIFQRNYCFGLVATVIINCAITVIIIAAVHFLLNFPLSFVVAHFLLVVDPYQQDAWY